MKNRRGGGVSGFCVSDSRQAVSEETASSLDGASKTMAPLKGGNSNLWDWLNEFFRSDCLPAAMARQSGQGCRPSKVLATASCKELCWRLLASMVVQATVWSKAHCPPRTEISASETKTLPKRANTLAPLNNPASKSRWKHSSPVTDYALHRPPAPRHPRGPPRCPCCVGDR